MPRDCWPETRPQTVGIARSWHVRRQTIQILLFQNHVVGFFQEAELPSRPGIYHYTPYRGVGHHRLHLALQSSGPQRCHYLLAGKECYFTVTSCPGYGQLELTGFETDNCG